MKKVVPFTTAAAVVAMSLLPATASYAAPPQNCDEARAQGLAPIHKGSPYYSTKLDRDGDGVACDNNGRRNPPPTTTPNQPQPPVSDPVWAWENCPTAFANGVANIPAGTPGYGTHLDSDLDGIGCEANGEDTGGVIPPYLVPPTQPQTPEPVTAHSSQVEQIPVGGADTGVPTTHSNAVPTSYATSPSYEAFGVGAAALAATFGGLAVRRVRSAKTSA